MDYPIIDYLSISVPQPNLMKQWEISYDQQIPFYVDERTWTLSKMLADQVNFRELPKGGIFKRHIQFTDIGVNYFEGHNSVSLVQIAGKGCSILREQGVLSDVLLDWNDRLTRLDIAVDIECDITPDDFALTRKQNRFKISERHDKGSGLTTYVGSPDSDRFARVYRYNPPDPRHNKLRVEYELCDEQAKLIAKRIIETDILHVAEELGNTFGWLHEVYVPSSAVSKSPTPRRNSAKGGTIHWLYKQVLPSLRKIAEMGELETLIGFDRAIRAIIDERTSETEIKNNGNA